EHATSVAIFANYLVVDTVLCSIPRFVLMTLLAGFGNFLCHPKHTSSEGMQNIEPYTEDGQQITEHLTGKLIWSRERCEGAVSILSMMAFVTVVGFTMVQLALALQVRAYSSRLWREKRKAREVLQGEMQVMSVI
ncbi:MAG: hypothetical protein M1830_000520, partial [Pleopsidium flavum]